MSEQNRPTRRRFLLIISLLSIMSMFLCGAFFLWLAWGANISKLPANVQVILQPFTDNISKHVHTAIINSSPDDSATQESGSDVNNPSNEPDDTSGETPTNEPGNNGNCMIGFSFDPIAQVCVEDVQAPQATETPGDSSSNQNCSVGFIFDPVLNTCVQVEVPATEISSSGSPQTCSVGLTLDPVLNTCVQIKVPATVVPGSSSSDTSTSNSNECSVGLTLDPVLGVCVGSNDPSSEPEPETTEAPQVIVEVSLPEIIPTELPDLPITLP